jgi:hypothetical protein
MTSITFPNLVKIRQNFPHPIVEDIPATVEDEMAKLLRAGVIGAGKKVGITVGSRGIQNIVPMLQKAAETIRAFGAEPVSSPPWAATAAALKKARWK